MYSRLSLYYNITEFFMLSQITAQQLSKLDLNGYSLFDIREDEDYKKGHILNAVSACESPIDIIKNCSDGKKIVIYCKDGRESTVLGGLISEQGEDVTVLEGGYQAWMRFVFRNDNFSADVEKSIRKKFSKTIWSKFTSAILEYDLIKENDKVAVCISGGKDSMLMAKLFQELKRHNKYPFEVEYMVMDPGYSKENRCVIENNAKMLDVPIKIVETDIFESVSNVEKYPCYLCARMRRGHLYKNARELGCNKIALGHHYDDVIETILMGMLYGGQVQTMMPKLHSTNYKGMELIRPMYLIRESDIIRWVDYNNLHFIRCACSVTEADSNLNPGDTVSKRQEIKHLIADLKKINPQIESNIFRSVENVNLDTVISYRRGEDRHSFLDDYDL